MSSPRPKLRLDWCSYEAAKYAVEHWHYSGVMQKTSNVCVGVWEDGQFKGAITFSKGSGNTTNGRRYGLRAISDMSELCRVALRDHVWPVSRMIKIALDMVSKQSPGLRLIVSFADPDQGHLGGIYQAGNWIYVGETEPSKYFQDERGRLYHPRAINEDGTRKSHHGKQYLGRLTSSLSVVHKPGKYKYLYPLDDEMRQRILPLSQPYPKRPKDSSEPPGVPAGRGRGSTDPDAPFQKG